LLTLSTPSRVLGKSNDVKCFMTGMARNAVDRFRRLGTGRAVAGFLGTIRQV